MSFLIQQRVVPRRPPAGTELDLLAAAAARNADPLNDLTYPGEERLGTSLAILPVSPQRVLVTWANLRPTLLRRLERAVITETAGVAEPIYCLRLYDITDVDF
ncbi:unnamed protein product, partial [marine sediment metagenome]